MISTRSIYTLHEHLFLTVLNRGRRLLPDDQLLIYLGIIMSNIHSFRKRALKKKGMWEKEEILVTTLFTVSRQIPPFEPCILCRLLMLSYWSNINVLFFNRLVINPLPNDKVKTLPKLQN